MGGAATSWRIDMGRRPVSDKARCRPTNQRLRAMLWPPRPELVSDQHNAPIDAPSQAHAALLAIVRLVRDTAPRESLAQSVSDLDTSVVERREQTRQHIGGA